MGDLLAQQRESQVLDSHELLYGGGQLPLAARSAMDGGGTLIPMLTPVGVTVLGGQNVGAGKGETAAVDWGMPGEDVRRQRPTGIGRRCRDYGEHGRR
ncbi:hypothetical protein BIV25_13220 [Streptomyces sp. MUSC 14]|uniref:hypothetical protein n=1 Tax=Streptomyces sp. MUSC 14 TaxID=1354889 RepID=UPI0008F5741D|nr:hypothetical protein [Streptomyces sp. MUSC 14]OIJ97762.1 hypothetical protein BIV25_13220 [Streptomyces sp. MUSC 14]